MSDLYHEFGQDLQQDATGDLLLATGWVQGSQSVECAVLLCEGDDPFNENFGAGAPEAIGEPAPADLCAGLVRAQLVQMPDIVSQINAITVNSTFDPVLGNLTVAIGYTDVDTGMVIDLPVVVKSNE